MRSKREKLLELIRIGQEQDIVPVDAILELGKLNTRDLIAELVVIPDALLAGEMIPADLLPLVTRETRGAVPPPHKLDLVLGSRGWQKMPTQTTIIKTGGGGGGGGTRYHNQLLDLDYATSGHTGFQAASAILTALSGLADAVGWLHNDGAGNLVWSTPAGGGNVFGAAPTVVNNFAAFDNLTGTLIKDSGYSASSFAAAVHTHPYQPIATILTTLSALANGAGWLENNGAGVLSWTTPPTHAAVTLANPDHGLGLAGQVLTLGTPSTLTAVTTNAVTTSTHTHAVTGFEPIDATIVRTGQANWIDLTDGGATTLHTHAAPAGMGDVLDSGIVVGQLTKGITDSKHITAAAIIPPTSNILTLTNAAASTLALAITAGKTLTLTSTGDYNLTVPASGTAALMLQDTRLNITADTPTIGKTALSTDKKEFYIANGTGWNIAPLIMPVATVGEDT